MADHLRPWKQVQHEFQIVEREKLKAFEQATLKKRVGEVQDQIDAARQEDRGGRAGATGTRPT